MVAFVRMFVLGAALAVVGCDGAGGLLVVTSTQGAGGATAVQGPSVTDFVSAGTVAKSSKYKVVYTLGQATPNQGVATSAQHRNNGGLVGAMNGTPASADAP
jgi:hypothetical protein